MKAVIAVLSEFSPPLAVVCVAQQVFGDPQQIADVGVQLSKCVELRGLQFVLAVEPNANRPACYDGAKELVSALFRIGWIRLPFQEVELTFSK